MEWMILPLKRYTEFGGRSRRLEFWLWTLFVIVVTILLGLVDSMLGLGGRFAYGDSVMTGPGLTGRAYGAGLHGGWLTHLFMLAVLIPNLAVAVRRLHDTDRSGWWILLPLLPYVIGFFLLSGGSMLLAMPFSLAGFVCAIVLLVWYCLRGTTGPNRFGPDPLAP